MEKRVKKTGKVAEKGSSGGRGWGDGWLGLRLCEAPAGVAHARQLGQSPIPARLATPAEKTALAVADGAVAINLSAAKRTFVTNEVSQAWNAAGDGLTAEQSFVGTSIGQENTFFSGLDGENKTLDVGYAQGTKHHAIDIAKAEKSHNVATAAVNPWASSASALLAGIEHSYKLDKAEAQLARETAEANADRDWIRDVTTLENSYINGEAATRKTLLDTHSSVAKVYSLGIATDAKQYDLVHMTSTANRMSAATTAHNLYRTGVANGFTNFRSADVAAQTSAAGVAGVMGGLVWPGPHLLRYVVLPEAYERLAADPEVSDPLTASDEIVAEYADHYFEYDADRRVTRSELNGGLQAFTYGYAESAFADDYNAWKYQTVQTGPDGVQTIVYSNYAYSRCSRCGSRVAYQFGCGSEPRVRSAQEQTIQIE